MAAGVLPAFQPPIPRAGAPQLTGDPCGGPRAITSPTEQCLLCPAVFLVSLWYNRARRDELQWAGRGRMVRKERSDATTALPSPSQLLPG